MKIRIPRPIYNAWNCFGDWGNRKTFGLLRIDILLAVFFVLGIIWYYTTGGWLLALQFAGLYIFILLCIFWMRR